MPEKAPPLEPAILELTKAAIEGNDQRYKDTPYSATVSELLNSFNSFLGITQAKIVDFRCEITTMLTALGVDQGLSNTFIQNAALAPRAVLLETISAMYKTIPNSYGDKFKLGARISGLQKCFDPNSLAVWYSENNSDDHLWVGYITEQVSSRNKEFLLV